MELYCAIQSCKVLDEGPEDGLFSDEDVGVARPVADGEEVIQEEEAAQEEIDGDFFHASRCHEYIEFV